jgi:predicted nucleic acid-binding OB-fold protein
MFGKIVLVLIMGSSFSWTMSASTVQTVSKEKLGCIKGLGLKRVTAIVIYRKNNTIESLDELLNVKGIGKGILKNIKEDKEKKVCTRFSEPKEKKRENSKKDISAE